MTCYIAHRINTVSALKDVPTHYGVELDLRDRNDRLILQHDPFADGEDFEDYLSHYRHGTMILNIKSERIEHRVLDLLRARGISDYFFLDSSFPMIFLLSGQGERRMAIRFSELEGLDTIIAMRGRVDWVWVDCFTRLPLDEMAYAALKDAQFKLCLVSPELQGGDPLVEIPRYAQALNRSGMCLDAVCTKKPGIWEEYY